MPYLRCRLRWLPADLSTLGSSPQKPKNISLLQIALPRSGVVENQKPKQKNKKINRKAKKKLKVVRISRATGRHPL